jgi:hypothetical protein
MGELITQNADITCSGGSRDSSKRVESSSARPVTGAAGPEGKAVAVAVAVAVACASISVS